MPKSTAPLTPAMLAALRDAKVGRLTACLYVSGDTHPKTFAGLVARELITLAGALTPAGVQVHAKAHPAPVEAPVETAETVDPLEAELPPLAEDRYFTHGAGADTLKRDAPEAEAPRFDFAARAAAQVKRDRKYAAQASSYVDRALPQREPGKALVEELLGGEVDEAMGLPAGVTDTEVADVLREHAVEKLTPVNPLSVLLRPVRGELVDRATREAFVAVGDVWGALEGSRVRIVCEDSSDMLHSRPLLLWPLRQSWDELHWADDADVTTFPWAPLLEGTVVQINGWAAYQLRSQGAGELPHLTRIN